MARALQRRKAIMFARTERLLLRPGWADDAAELTRAVANEKIARNLVLLPWPYSESDALSFLENVHGTGKAEFLIFARTDGAPELVGGIGLHKDPEADPEDEGGAPELGYWIAEAHWGKGYATEAARAVLDLARGSLKLQTIKAAYFKDNPASGAVLRKLGFKPTGRVVPRYSNGRRATVPTVLVSADLSEGDDAKRTPPTLMTPFTERLAA
jgi:RimJ/RimL family protein N-acetyltransferase